MTPGLENHLVDQLDGGDLFWHRLRWRIVRQYLPKSKEFTLLDVGAGAGLLGHRLADEFPSARYRFIEPIAALREALRRRVGADADFAAQESFAGVDVVVLLDVLEHQADDEGFMRELVRKMAPTATLLLTVPALPALWSAWDEGLGHYRRYTRRTLREVLERTGLEVNEVSYLFPEMVPPALARRFAPRPRVLSASEYAMPRLPRLVNHLLYSVGLVSQLLRRFHFVGTSVFAVARKPATQARPR